MPDGAYRIKIVASDAPSHTPGEAMQGERISDRFLVDTAPPIVSGLTAKLEGSVIHATMEAADKATPIARAEYSLTRGRGNIWSPWVHLSDSLHEQYDFRAPLPSRREGCGLLRREHILTVRVL